jgi:acyl-CoA synthetase (AMP-forming)/AMP-acid ligase II
MRTDRKLKEIKSAVDCVSNSHGRLWRALSGGIINATRILISQLLPINTFTGDGALRDEVGYYRITGRVDDVIIVSGHNLGTAPIEDAINEHPAVAESAIVGFPHDIKGSALYGYITLKDTGESRDHNNVRKEINQLITERIGPIAKLDKIQFTPGLPKTRSGKIMRRILRKIASRDTSNLGDTSTLLNPRSCGRDHKEFTLIRKSPVRTLMSGLFYGFLVDW